VIPNLFRSLVSLQFVSQFSFSQLFGFMGVCRLATAGLCWSEF
jgi:hypothetical protein